MQEQKKKPWNFLKSEGDISADKPAKNTRKKLIAELVKTSILDLSAFFAIVLGTAAWFASNTKVDSGGIMISHQYDTIRLATKGERQTADKLLNLPEDLPEQTLQFGGDTYYYTEDGTIALRLSEDNIVVFPGASGTVTFYVIPTQDGEISLTLYVALAGYSQNNTSAERIVDSTLDALLSGHILLFRNKDENGHYSGWLGMDSAITVSENATKDTPVEVTFYWIWPLRYENMLSDLYVDETQANAEGFMKFLNDQATAMPSIPNTTYRYSRIYLTNEADLTTTASRSKAYNLADEYIGTNAQYLYLAIQTSTALAETN